MAMDMDDEDGGKDRGGDVEPGCCEGKVDCTEEKIRNGQTDFEIVLLKVSTGNEN